MNTMARKPNLTDYTVQVPDVGSFTFGRRTMRDEVSIQVEFAKIIDGAPVTEWLQAVGGWLSTLRVLTVRAPDGWDLDALDPLDSDTYARLNAVYEGLRTAEESFRRGQGMAGA